jgi:hypothetical protein
MTMAQEKAPTVRTKRIPVPVNREELKKFTALAKAEHKSLAQLIREFLYSRLEEKKA